MSEVTGARRGPGSPQDPAPAAGATASGADPGARPGPGARALRLARRHWLFLLVLALAAVARGYVTAAYSTALWFPDSGTYADRAASMQPAVDRPWGYSAFLALLNPVTTYREVAVVQHVLGLAMVALVYLLLQRRGVAPWIGVLAVLPLAFDAYLLDIEHFILAETLFMFLMTGAVVLLLVRERPGALVAGTVGVLMGLLTLTRTVGLFLIGVVAVYLLVRLLVRTLRWTAVVAFLVGVAAVLLPYAGWFSTVHGSVALTDYTGHFLYGRVATFVQCEELDVPERLQPLCPEDPPEERRPGDQFVWFPDSPANAVEDGVPVWSEEELAEFATIAIRGQPGDYLRQLLSETVHYVEPGRVSGPQDTCPGWWAFPYPDLIEQYDCRPLLAPGPFGYDAGMVGDLRSYQRYFYTPGPLLGLCLLVGLGALLARRRGRRDRLDPALLALLGLTLMAGPAATASFDFRYVLPTLAVLPPAAALALRGVALAAGRGQRGRQPEVTPPEPRPEPAPTAGR
ncbi:Dolichyl-phosphate-mannose-protein mannosyltransferase [Geodermatophilus pulveris]|uniref:Dolichyl-phosphate-mannose-protein mannosyltransferase n=1 Tax=Geodermatophilus pulveris TaxID=1564159 RepID=A0A239EKC5_9ACTN|nr:phospholipid carrier-dependent glycosyltransferase [Geodermatophilus pulveris]SNS44503.1 Dolichyl-phosphate-mannose-protein mannosyltransferase [Geodermatophilus pulveris]